MAYDYITNIDALNFTPPHHVPAVFGGYSRRIDFIGIHHWGNPGQQFWDVVRYLASANARQSSAHEVIEAGRVACIIDHSNASWAMANPTGYPNARGLHLELRPEATDADYVTAAERIVDLRAMHGDVPLRPHNEFTQTACPGAWDLTRLDRMARAVTSAPVIVPAAPIPKEWDEMASKDEVKAAYREVLTEPAVLDRLALAILKRPCHLVDPSGESFEITGTTTLATKINFAAHNDAQHHKLLVEIKEAVTGLAAPEPADQPAPEVMAALEAAVPSEVPPVASA